MNKKRLSVVMAGAMLASSVAPVLAAEVQKSEASAAELGLLIQKVRNKLESAKFANETDADKTRNANLAGKSVYYIKIDNKAYTYDQLNTQSKLQNVLGALKTGQKVEIWSNGYVTEGEGENLKYYAREAATTDKYVAEDFFTESGNTNTLTQTIENSLKRFTNLKDNVAVTVASVGAERVIQVKLTGGITLTIKEGDVKYNFNKFINATGGVQNLTDTTAVTDIKGFPKVDSTYTEIADEKLEEITITSGGQDLAIEDLYDGLMLTEKGHDFFSMLKEADAMGRGYYINGNAGEITGKPSTALTSTQREAKKSLVAGAIAKNSKGNYVFSITFPAYKLEGTDVKELPEVTYTITSKDEKNAERLASWMLKPLARVDILAGSNRYETAVKIAKEYAGLTGGLTGNTVTGTDAKANIVLVNGNALVDGLAASPLASALSSTTHKAPILLTEADALPKETKAYLKEILANVQIGKLSDVTINLVGGESVLNKSLERELKGLGFKVERFGGDNREETSLEVAEAIEDITDTEERFVVGADGEADAMSIASVAAYNKTPIVVAKRGGISEDALDTFHKNANIAVIGGKSVVTESELKELKAVSKSVTRIAGDNRKATNAKIIETYYNRNFVGTVPVGNGQAGTTDHVLVAKDGQRNKTELVDALAAANFASHIKAPIVLATDKLSKEQINALELNTKESTALYQIGHGVARDVVKTIAEGLNLTNSNRY